VLNGYDFETHSGEYRIEQCARCNIRFTNPQPVAADIPLLYAERKSADFATGGRIANALRRFVNKRLIRSLPKDVFEKDVSVLDFACGSGFFTTVARKEFSGRVAGSDFHEAAPSPEFARLGIDYIRDSALDAEGPSFDVIFCRNVLEHAIDPRAMLARLQALMRPRGYLLIEVPHGNSMWAKIFGKYCYNYYLPRHLFHFDRDTLQGVMKGFDRINCWTAHSPLMGMSIGYRLGFYISNISLFGLALFPLQVLVDAPFGRAPVLYAIYRKSE